MLQVQASFTNGSKFRRKVVYVYDHVQLEVPGKWSSSNLLSLPEIHTKNDGLKSTWFILYDVKNQLKALDTAKSAWRDNILVVMLKIRCRTLL